METIYRKVAVRDIEKLMEDSLTIKKRGGEYRTALNHVLNISKDLDEIQLQKDKEELLEMLEMIVDGTAFCNKSGRIWQHWLETIESLIQKHKQ